MVHITKILDTYDIATSVLTDVAKHYDNELPALESYVLDLEVARHIGGSRNLAAAAKETAEVLDDGLVHGLFDINDGYMSTVIHIRDSLNHVANMLESDEVYC